MNTANHYYLKAICYAVNIISNSNLNFKFCELAAQNSPEFA